MSSLRFLSAAGTLLICVALFACGGDSSGPVPVASVSLSPGSVPEMVVGETFQLSATPADAEGNSLSGREITWNSLSSSVATVSTSGLVTAVGVGSTTITAEAGGEQASTTVTVIPPPVASVEVSPADPEIVEGETVQLTATLRDQDGAVLTGRPITWTSSTEAVAMVGSTGLVAGVAAGTADITATSEGVSGGTTVTVEAVPTMEISSISPSPLVEGEHATISGQGFSSVLEDNEVLIGGFAATVTSASTTELEVVVTMECYPEGTTTVEVASVGRSSVVEEHPIEPSSTALDMTVGEQVILTGSDLCVRLDAGDSGESYLVGVQSISETPGNLTPARIRGQVPLAATGAPPFGPAASASAAGAADPGGSGIVRPELPNRWQRHRAAEASLRAEEVRALEELRARGAPLATPAEAEAPASAGASGISASMIPDDLSVDDVVAIRVPDRSGNICTDYIEIDATVRAVGTNGVWLEDVDNPEDGFTTADFEELSDRFDDHIYATDTDYFGEPTDLDGNDRIAIVTTKEVNISEGILGFVASTDFFERSSNGCPSSNEGEIYYGKAPDPDGEFGDSYTVEDALLDAPKLIAHEFTHILQFGLRLMSDHPTLSRWEAEGQATFAEEVVGFAVNGRSEGQNYGASVAFGEDADGINWHIGGFGDLAYYFGFESPTSSVTGAPEQCTWIGAQESDNYGPCEGRAFVYGVSWSFLRWLSDQFGPDYPDGERGIHRDLIDNSQVGYANIESVVGEPINELLARWAAMLYVDDRVAQANPELTLTSWNLVDVFDNIFESGHLKPYEYGFETFSEDVSVRAASTAYFRLDEDPQTPMSVRARNQGDGDLPTHMQMWVVRLQ